MRKLPDGHGVISSVDQREVRCASGPDVAAGSLGIAGEGGVTCMNLRSGPWSFQLVVMLLSVLYCGWTRV